MSEIALLVELYNVDMRMDENAAVLARLETNLADGAEIESARAEFELSDRRAAQLRAELRTLELETNSLAEKIKEVNERLYSGRITNAKELAGLNQDEGMLERRKAELEDKELELMEQIEAAEKIVAANRTGYESSASRKAARNVQERADLTVHQAEQESLSRKREAVRGQISAESLRIYDLLRRTKKGRAVAFIKGSSCSACGYEVPSGLLSRAKTGSELIFCSNCERILAP